MKYILKGTEIEEIDDLFEWGRWFEDFNNRKLAHTSIGEMHISTVFLGIDRGHGHGPPVLFETMHFGGPFDGDEDRYCTHAEAMAGHEIQCERVRRHSDWRDPSTPAKPTEAEKASNGQG